MKVDGLGLFEELGVLAFAGTGGDFKGFGLIAGLEQGNLATQYLKHKQVAIQNVKLLIIRVLYLK